VVSFLLHNPFIYRDAGNIHGVVFVTDAATLAGETAHALLTDYYLPGMQSLRICGVESGGEWTLPPVTAAGYQASTTGRSLYTRAK
jgi:hypothetical protein